jgi:signal transduction histidine kinase
MPIKRQWTLQDAIIAFLGGSALLFLALSSDRLFSTSGFEPHGHCFLWIPGLVWLFVGSDLSIALSYFSIAITLIYLVHSARNEIPFNWVVVAFGVFIFACGMTHLVAIITLWQPEYWLSAGVKFITAVASVTTAVALPPLVPRIQNLTREARLSRERKARLEIVVGELEHEIIERKRAEEAVRQLNAELESRIEERTAELRAANMTLDELLQREQQARAEAERANALKLKFLAMISHELRTPLTPIKGLTTTLLATDVVFDSETQAEFLRVIDEETDRMIELVEQLLDVSRMHAGTLRVQPTSVPLKTIINQSMARLEAFTVNHQMRLEIDPALPPVMADAARIAQVLVNLVSNATRYAPKNTLITLAVRQQGAMIEVSVTDQGMGIPAQYQELVFESFQQIKRSGDSKRGAGLGLAICKWIVEAHGGSIRIAESSPAGTTIIFTLPKE